MADDTADESVRNGEPGRDPAPTTVSLDGIPSSVATALLDVVELLVPAKGVDLYPDSETSRKVAGDLITAARGVQAWAEAAEIEGARRLLKGIEDDPVLDLGQRDPGASAVTVRSEARRAAAVELQLLTGQTQTACSDRVALASATQQRAGYLRDQMRDGALSAQRAICLLKETRHLDPVTADAIARRVLAPLGKAPLSQNTFRQRLARQLTRAESASAAAARKRQDALSARDTVTMTNAFGMAVTEITASRERALAAQTRVNDLARAARAAGDQRTLAQLRSDIATDLLICGQVPGDPLLGSAPAARLNIFVNLATLIPWSVGSGSRGGGPDADASAPGTSCTGASAPEAAGGGASVPGTSCGGAASGTSGGRTPTPGTSDTTPYDGTLGSQGPAAGGGRGGSGRGDRGPGTAGGGHVDGVGEVPGYGWLSAEQVRELAFAAGSTWRRLVTDPVTGAVIDSERTYRPSTSMRRLVQSRDGTCRAPGCSYPASESDVDHDVPWRPGARAPAEGATHPDNLHVLHRGHHHAKTRGWWSSEQDVGGRVRWRTLSGRELTTHPPDRHDATEDCLPDATELERAAAGWFEHATDPPPAPSAAASAVRAAVDRVNSRRAPEDRIPVSENAVGPNDPPPF